MKKLFLMTVLSMSFVFSSAAALAGHHGGCQGHKCKLMKRADTNDDGIVSKAEFMAQSEKRFSKIDTDGNDELSAEELKAARSKMKAHKAKMVEKKEKSSKTTAE
jgi:hypothetical protein